MAASLKNEPGVEVQVVNGDHGEFSVSVDGRVVAKKGASLPSADEVLAAVRQTGAPAHA